MMGKYSHANQGDVATLLFFMLQLKVSLSFSFTCDSAVFMVWLDSGTETLKDTGRHHVYD